MMHACFIRIDTLPEERYSVSVAEGTLFARHFGWNLHPNPQTLEAEIEGMNICDLQYAGANKVPYEHLNAQKLLNKATIEGRAHGAAMARWGMYRPMLKTVHK